MAATDSPKRRRSRVRTLANQSALYGLAGALGKALALLTVPILTRLLSPAEYGLADLANTLAAMLAILAMFAGDIPASRLAGQSTSATERVRVLSSYVWTTLVVSVFLALALLPFSGLIATNGWSAPDGTAIAILAIVLIPISTLQASLVTASRIDSRPVAFAVLQCIDLLAQMILAVTFVVIGWGALGMVLGFVAGSLIGLGAAAVYHSRLLINLPDWGLGRVMLTEGLAFLPATLGFVVATYVVRFVLVDWQGAHAVGLFGVASRLASGMALATAAFSMAWGPYGLALPDSLDTARLFGRVMRTYALLAVLVSVVLAAAAPELVLLISGPEYVDASTMLPGLISASAMAGGFYVLLVAAGVSRRGGAVGLAAIAGAIGQVVSTMFLLPVLGLPGVGVGAALGQAVALILLGAAIATAAHSVVPTVVALCAGGTLVVGLQALNAAPESTLLLRALIVVVSAAISGVALFRLLSGRREPTQLNPA
jgi:O-antigen/teichoic acid export membrane protein